MLIFQEKTTPAIAEYRFSELKKQFQEVEEEIQLNFEKFLHILKKQKNNNNK